ncbi:MAG TPA: carbon-nitrogen family hydrolase [Deltaproteobacteria bacterium]|nr:carbon-nitrogen family hydrolase [Deltaproteobacteria bacterium]
MRDIVAGCCQFSIKPGEVQRNCETAEGMLLELAAGKCRLAVLPEMWSCSFPYPVLREMAEKTPEILDRMCKIALDKRLVIAGSLPEAAGKTIFNTGYLIDSTGKIAGRYRKVHLFSLYNEQRHFGYGTSAQVFSTSIGKIGMMICYDLRFPELARKMALDGAEIICVSALWPLVRIEHWSLLLRARAIENQLFVVGCNGCGAEEKITWGGASAIISPLGTVLAQAGQDEQSIVRALNPFEMSDFRKTIPCFEDRVPEVYNPYNADICGGDDIASRPEGDDIPL